MIFSCVQIPKKAMAVDSPHIVIAWSDGFTARVWSAEPKEQWNYLWLRAVNRQAKNADVIQASNFELYTDEYQNSIPDIFLYSNIQFTITADNVSAYANKPAKIFVEYWDKTFDTIEGTFDNWATFAFVLQKPALITTDSFVPDKPEKEEEQEESYINFTDYSPKTGIF